MTDDGDAWSFADYVQRNDARQAAYLNISVERFQKLRARVLEGHPVVLTNPPNDDEIADYEF